MKFDYEGIKTSTFLYFTERGLAVLFLLRFIRAGQRIYEDSLKRSSGTASAGSWNDFKSDWKRRDPTTAGLCPIMHWAGDTAGLVCQFITNLSANNYKKQRHTSISHQACWHFRIRFTSGGFWRCQHGSSAQGSRGQSRWQARMLKPCASCAFTLITPTITTASNQASGDEMFESTCKSPPNPHLSQQKHLMRI